jgi:hypothetical protein
MLLAFLMLAGLEAVAPVHAQSDWTSQVCGPQHSSASTTVGNLKLPNGNPFDVHRAMALFRFNRQKEALRELDEALSNLRGPWRWRVRDDQRKRLTADLNAFRRCIADTEAPAMATLTVDTFLVEPAESEQRRLTIAGATVKVEDLPVGRTGEDGTLMVRVPSGAIRVTAELAPTTWGDAYVTVSPGGSERLSLAMDAEKEVSEDTNLVVVEAVDDIIPVTSPSFTLKFTRGDRVAPVVSVVSIYLLDRDEDFERNLEELFTVANSAITANGTAEVFDSLAKHFGETITLQVSAEDAAGGMHYGEVRFRVGQSRLLVTLSPPPSNPALPVANIEVGVSIVGAGIAVPRVSDAEGRFEIEALPHGTIAFDCETISNGLYYYCGGTMANWGEQSVMLVLRHVTDLVNGVPAVRLQPNAPAAPRVERKGGR